MGNMDALKDLLRQMLEGRPFSQEQLDQMGQKAGMNQGSEMYQRQWFERRMNRQAGMQQLQDLIEQLLQELEAMGMSDEALEDLRQQLQENAQGLSEQISQYAGCDAGRTPGGQRT